MEPLRVNNRPEFGAIRAPTHDAGGPSGTNRRSGGFVEIRGPLIGLLSEEERFYWLSRLSVKPPVARDPAPSGGTELQLI